MGAGDENRAAELQSELRDSAQKIVLCVNERQGWAMGADPEVGEIKSRQL